jgi:hypothetical protein
MSQLKIIPSSVKLTNPPGTCGVSELIPATFVSRNLGLSRGRWSPFQYLHSDGPFDVEPDLSPSVPEPSIDAEFNIPLEVCEDEDALFVVGYEAAPLAGDYPKAYGNPRS